MIEGTPLVIEWMYWTYPSAIFLASLFIAITGLAVWDMASPCIPRKGFLPIVTTRGDRFFIGVISTLLIHLIWIAAFQVSFLWIASLISVSWFTLLGFKG